MLSVAVLLWLYQVPLQCLWSEAHMMSDVCTGDWAAVCRMKQKSGSVVERRVRLRTVNPHIICCLCKGYMINATTITECLHTCKSPVSCCCCCCCCCCCSSQYSEFWVLALYSQTVVQQFPYVHQSYDVNTSVAIHKASCMCDWCKWV